MLSGIYYNRKGNENYLLIAKYTDIFYRINGVALCRTFVKKSCGGGCVG